MNESVELIRRSLERLQLRRLNLDFCLPVSIVMMREVVAYVDELEKTVVRQATTVDTQRESLVSRRARIEELEAEQARMITRMAAGKETKP